MPQQQGSPRSSQLERHTNIACYLALYLVHYSTICVQGRTPPPPLPMLPIPFFITSIIHKVGSHRRRPCRRLVLAWYSWLVCISSWPTSSAGTTYIHPSIYLFACLYTYTTVTDPCLSRSVCLLCKEELEPIEIGLYTSSSCSTYSHLPSLFRSLPSPQERWWADSKHVVSPLLSLGCLSTLH
ncbi:hypothetical protein F5Y01DRAFT_237965 [Xylaria sp. FL0043]|nr:hypothetical protein F5Y01DRAFT_237965 [Xylaria sp. FL0043]